MLCYVMICYVMFNEDPKMMFSTSIITSCRSKVLQNAGGVFSNTCDLHYHLSLRSLFCLFLSGRLRQGSLYQCRTYLTHLSSSREKRTQLLQLEITFLLKYKIFSNICGQSIILSKNPISN